MVFASFIESVLDIFFWVKLHVGTETVLTETEHWFWEVAYIVTFS